MALRPRLRAIVLGCQESLILLYRDLLQLLVLLDEVISFILGLERLLYIFLHDHSSTISVILIANRLVPDLSCPLIRVSRLGVLRAVHQLVDTVHFHCHFERAPNVRLRLDCDVTTKVPANLFAYGQSNSVAPWVQTPAHSIIRRVEGNKDALELLLRHTNASVSHSHFDETFVLAIVHESLLEIDDNCFDCDRSMLLEFNGV